MKRPYKKKKQRFIDIALERIQELFDQADAVFESDPQMADRYVKIARDIAMKYRVPIASQLQKKFCKHCYIYLRPGSNCRVRIVNSKLVYTCFSCRNYMRFPLHG